MCEVGLVGWFSVKVTQELKKKKKKNNNKKIFKKKEEKKGVKMPVGLKAIIWVLIEWEKST